MPSSLANMEAGHQRSLELHMDSVTEGLIPLLLGHQLDTIYENLSILQKRNKDWISIQLLDAEGRTIYPLSTSPTTARHGRDVHILRRQIKYLDMDLGLLVVTVDFAPRLSEMKKKHWELITATLIIIAAFIATIGFILERVVIRPVNLLARASQRLAEGGFDVPLVKAGDDEVGTLVDSFEDMRKAIREYRSTLHRLNRELRAISNCNQILMRARTSRPCSTTSAASFATRPATAWPGWDMPRTMTPGPYVPWPGPGSRTGISQTPTSPGPTRNAGAAPPEPPSGAEKAPASRISRLTPKPPRGATMPCSAAIAPVSPCPSRTKAQNLRRLSPSIPPKPNAFTPDEIRLLEELAGDLAFGIMVLRARIERKRAEEALRAERGLFVGGPTVVFKWKAQEGWPVEYVSPNVADQFGYTPEELTSGKVQYAAIVHPDDLARVAAEVSAYSEQGVASFEQMYRIARADGRYRWIHDFTTVIRGRDGAITHYLGYILDITERKQAEEALRRLNEELEQRVQDRTAELELKNADLEKLNKIFVGRELRMIELKERIKELEKQIGSSST